VLFVDDEITEIKCSNEGSSGQHGFMNTDKLHLRAVESFRLGFSDKNGGLYGWMMQGPEGDDIVTTGNWEDSELEAALSRHHAKRA
jgi:hypothetical protein